MSNDTSKILSMSPIGKIVGVHGIKGYIAIKSFAGNPEDIFDYCPLFDQSGDTEFDIALKHPKKGVFICECKGITDRNAAEALRGTELYMLADKLPTADDNEYFIADLIGLDVQNTDGVIIGTVHAMHDFGAGDIVEVHYAPEHRTETSQDMLLFNKQTIPEVNIKDGYIVINPMDMV